MKVKSKTKKVIVQAGELFEIHVKLGRIIMFKIVAAVDSIELYKDKLPKANLRTMIKK